MSKTLDASAAAAALGRIRSDRKAASSAKNARRATRIRMQSQTPAQRVAQAQAAARARWDAVDRGRLADVAKPARRRRARPAGE